MIKKNPNQRNHTNQTNHSSDKWVKFYYQEKAIVGWVRFFKAKKRKPTINTDKYFNIL